MATKPNTAESDAGATKRDGAARAILQALGLDPATVRSFTISAEAGKLVTAEVSHVFTEVGELPAFELVKYEIKEPADGDQE